MPCLAGFSEASTRYQNQTLKGSYPPLAPPISWILSSTSAKGQWKAWNMLRGALHGRSKVHLWSRKVRKIFVKGIHCHCRFVSFFPISIRVIIFKQKTSCWVTIVAWFCAFLVCILLFFLVFFGACLLLHGNPSLDFGRTPLPIRSRKSVCRCLRHGTYMGVSLNGGFSPHFPPQNDDVLVGIPMGLLGFHPPF